VRVAHDRPPNQNHVLEDLLKLFADTVHLAETEITCCFMVVLFNHTDLGDEQFNSVWDVHQKELTDRGEG